MSEARLNGTSATKHLVVGSMASWNGPDAGEVRQGAAGAAMACVD